MCKACEEKIEHLNTKIKSIEQLEQDSIIHDFITSMDYHEWCTANVTIEESDGDYCRYEVTIKNMSERVDCDILQSEVLNSLYKHNLYLKLIRYGNDSIELLFDENTKSNLRSSEDKK